LVWRRPDEIRLCSTLLMAFHSESWLFRLVIICSTFIKERAIGEFSMGRVRQCPYKTIFLCYFLEFAPLF
jgi:hypothetical protein